MMENNWANTGTHISTMDIYMEGSRKIDDFGDDGVLFSIVNLTQSYYCGFVVR